MRTGAVSGCEQPFEDIFDDAEQPLGWCGMIDYTVDEAPAAGRIAPSGSAESKKHLLQRIIKLGVGKEGDDDIF